MSFTHHLSHLTTGTPAKWGPSHSFTSDESQFKTNNNNNNHNSGGGGIVGSWNNLFQPITSSTYKSSPTNTAAAAAPSSPSKGSQGNNSKETDQSTAPVTKSTSESGNVISQQLSLKTGMSSAPTTPGSSNMLGSAATANTTTTAALAGGGGSGASSGLPNFWNTHAQPATSDESASIGQTYASAMSPLSTSAKAAADVVLGMISKAEHFIASSTGGAVGSPSGGGGLCSTPRNSPSNRSNLDLEGIPEETAEEACIGGDNNNCAPNCFEFEEFGFNAFQEDSQSRQFEQSAGIAAVSSVGDGGPLTLESKQSTQPNTGYEIRLKSSFSQAKAQRELQREKKLEQQQQQQEQKQQPQPSQQVSANRASTINNIGSAFGRTHPNNKNKAAQPRQQQQSQQQQQEENNEFTQGSRALPNGLPFREVSVPTEIERSVSELTMRSHGAFERQRYTSDSRRMAYYAVGRTNNNVDDGKNKPGGNRRCYFTGMSIPYGMPFYAGSVQQGPRTLVVFCLPSALDLPNNGDSASLAQDQLLHRFSNKADREKYLDSLPEPDTKLLQEMSRRYPDPFETLPVQVRSPHCWRLFVKFCFFSGLPIAEGEMHYRVKSSVKVFPPSLLGSYQEEEEIALSHEVMEGKTFDVVLFNSCGKFHCSS